MVTSVTITKADIDNFLRQITANGGKGMFLHDFPVDAHNFSIALRADGSFLIVYESASTLPERHFPAAEVKAAEVKDVCLPERHFPASWKTLQEAIEAGLVRDFPAAEVKAAEVKDVCLIFQPGWTVAAGRVAGESPVAEVRANEVKS